MQLSISFWMPFLRKPFKRYQERRANTIAKKDTSENTTTGISPASLLLYLYVSTGYGLMELYNTTAGSGTIRLMTSASEIGLDPAARFGDF